MRRVLSGERVTEIIEVRSEELSDVLAEAALVLRDRENNNDPYSPLFTIQQGWNVNSEEYELLIFVRH